MQFKTGLTINMHTKYPLLFSSVACSLFRGSLIYHCVIRPKAAGRCLTHEVLPVTQCYTAEWAVIMWLHVCSAVFFWPYSAVTLSTTSLHGVTLALILFQKNNRYKAHDGNHSFFLKTSSLTFSLITKLRYITIKTFSFKTQV